MFKLKNFFRSRDHKQAQLRQLYKDMIAKEVGVQQHLTPGSSDGNLSLAIKSLAGATATYFIAEHTRQSARFGSDVETPKACMKHVKRAMFGMGNIVALQGAISVPFDKDTFIQSLTVKAQAIHQPRHPLTKFC